MYKLDMISLSRTQNAFDKSQVILSYMKVRRTRNFILLLSFFIIVYIFLFTFSPNTINNPIENMDICKNYLINDLSRSLMNIGQYVLAQCVADVARNLCSLKDISLERFWGSFPWDFRPCTQNWFENELQPLKLTNRRFYHKYFLHPNNTQDDCNVVTIGIGQDIMIELGIKQKYRHCNFIGIDPISDVHKEQYEKLVGGDYVEKAIGPKSGDGKAYIYKTNGEQEHYHKKNVSFTTLTQFFKINGQIKMVDLLNVDNADSDIYIIDQLLDGIDLPPICQINIELHNPTIFGRQYKLTIQKLFNLFYGGEFLSLNVEMNAAPHAIRMFLLNIKSKECVAKYLDVELSEAEAVGDKNP